MSRSVSHGHIYEYIDERLQVAYCYYATLPSQRTYMKQQLATTVQPESYGSVNHDQASVSESPAASDYQFTESDLVDKKVS